MSDYRLRCRSALAEDAVHRLGPSDDDGPDLLPVNGFGDGRAGVADQAGDVLNGHAVIGQQRHEAVPQLAGCPLPRYEPGGLGDLPEVTPHIVRVQRRPDAGREHQTIALGALGVPACPLVP